MALHADEQRQADVPRQFLSTYCVDCHSGPDAEARVDLEGLLADSQTSENPLETDYETWKTVNQLIADGVMPPADTELPTAVEKEHFASWFSAELAKVVPEPGPLQARRLAKHEFRNTLRSVFGFDLQVNIMEAEQTVTERSLVLKLLPTDPPGRSGFTNDTHANPLSSAAWDQYMYLTDSVTRELFEPQRSQALNKLSQSNVAASNLNASEAKKLLHHFLVKARRREISQSELTQKHTKFENLSGQDLVAAIRLEMQAELLSPRFLFRGTLHPHTSGDSNGSQQTNEFPPVDEFELAERLSYFLWADMPDEELLEAALIGHLRTELDKQVVRMLASPKSRSLATDFAAQWLGLDEINLQVSNNPPQLDALRTQPLDFLHYLFAEDRPLLEIISSQVTFVNPHTAKYYGGSIYKQLPKYRKQKGIEVEIVANSRVRLDPEFQRGGILTMPGILAMNRSPILRGTWLLERVLGHELPEPPPNVPAIPPADPQAKNVTFRERFEQHRSQETCAVCHDKIDPLGFAFDNFDAKGKLRGNPAKNKKPSDVELAIDTSGQLPDGKRFQNAEELKTILLSSQRKQIVQNIVEKTLAYALCRELSVHDVPTVNTITAQMMVPDATWQDLFLAIAHSLPFQRHRPPAS